MKTTHHMAGMASSFYTRVASQEECDCLENDGDINQTTLKFISKYGEILIDENTKTPYIVFNKVRYDIEPVIEQIMGEVKDENAIK